MRLVKMIKEVKTFFTKRKTKKREELEFDAKQKSKNYFNKYHRDGDT